VQPPFQFSDPRHARRAGLIVYLPATPPTYLNAPAKIRAGCAHFLSQRLSLCKAPRFPRFWFGRQPESPRPCPNCAYLPRAGALSERDTPPNDDPFNARAARPETLGRRIGFPPFPGTPSLPESGTNGSGNNETRSGC